MKEVEYDGVTYSIGKLNTLQQFHVARRLAPLITDIGMLMRVAGSNSSDDATFEQMLGPIALALAGMSDETSEYVIFTCMDAVKVKQGPGWASAINKQSKMFMFPQLNESMLTVMQLVKDVIQENILNFIPGVLPSSPTAVPAGASKN